MMWCPMFQHNATVWHARESSVMTVDVAFVQESALGVYSCSGVASSLSVARLPLSGQQSCQGAGISN